MVDRGDGPQAGSQPADIAVLVRTNARGEAIRDALVASRDPRGDARCELGLRLRRGPGLADPADRAGAAAAGDRPAGRADLLLRLDLRRAGPGRPRAEMVDLTQRVRWWSRMLAEPGVAALLEAATAEAGVPERLLATRGGERRLTDLRHLAQSLHAARTAGQLGVGALVEWLRSRMAEARGNGSDDETRRLETDARAVTILTVHRSKGLEFPVVYLPEAWDRHVSNVDEGRILRLHEPEPATAAGLRARRRRPVRAGPVRPLRPVPGRGGRRGPPAGLRRAHPGQVPGGDLVGRLRTTPRLGAAALPVPRRPRTRPSRSPAYAMQDGPVQRPGRWVPRSASSTVTERPRPWQPAEPTTGRSCAARTFDAVPGPGVAADVLLRADRGRPRCGRASRPGVGSEPEGAKEDDEVGRRRSADRHSPGPLPAPSPRRALADGRAAARGGVRHAGARGLRAGRPAMRPDLPSRGPASVRGRAGPVPGRARHRRRSGRPACCRSSTPRSVRSPATGRLRDIPMADRLAELSFELALAGGDTTTAEITVGDARRRCCAGTCPATTRWPATPTRWPSRRWPTRRCAASSPAASTPCSGSPTQDADPRYLVVDYKTNWLGPLDGPDADRGRLHARHGWPRP